MGKGVVVLIGGLAVVGVGVWGLLSVQLPDRAKGLTAQPPPAADAARVNRVVQGMADSLVELERQGRLARLTGAAGTRATSASPAIDWSTYIQQKGLADLDRELEEFLGDTPAQKAARRLMVLGKTGARASGEDWGLATQAFEELDARPAETLADLQRSLERMPDDRPIAERNYLIQLVSRMAEHEEARAGAIELLQRETQRRAAAGSQAGSDGTLPGDVSSASFAFLQLKGLGSAEGAQPPTAQEDPWVNEIPDLKGDGAARVPAATPETAPPANTEGSPDSGAP